MGCPCCRCDGLAVPATIVSAPDRCTLPETAGAGGRAPIEVSLNGQNYHGGADVESLSFARYRLDDACAGGCYGNGDGQSNKCECRVGYSGDACDVGPVPLTALPAAGPQQGGTRVLLKGARLGADGASALQHLVLFEDGKGGSMQLEAQYNAADDVVSFYTALTPLDGTVALRVSINGGLDFSESSVPFTFTFEPSITGLEPASGPWAARRSSRSPAPSSVPPLS